MLTTQLTAAQNLAGQHFLASQGLTYTIANICNSGLFPDISISSLPPGTTGEQIFNTDGIVTGNNVVRPFSAGGINLSLSMNKNTAIAQAVAFLNSITPLGGHLLGYGLGVYLDSGTMFYSVSGIGVYSST